MKKLFLIIILVIFLVLFLIDGNVFTEEAFAQRGTEVGGILEENTIWVLENSPYIITALIQIPENVTLIIEPGVNVISNIISNDPVFYFSGKIFAEGTIEHEINFVGNDDGGWFRTAGDSKTASLVLDYCIVEGTGFGGGKYFDTVVIRNSKIYAPFRISTRIYGSNCTMEYNILGNANIRAMDFSKPIYVKNNLFLGAEGDFVSGITYEGATTTILKYNSFINLNPDENKVRYFKELDITENFWGTTNTSIIDEIILDRNDFNIFPGYVDYLPILTEPHFETPKLPLETEPPTEDIITVFVDYVIDGDTFDTAEGYRIRLADIDAPEYYEDGYQSAKDFLISLINGKTVYLDIDDIYRTGPYGRLICVVYVTYNSTHYLNVNKALLVEDYAEISNFDNEFNPYSWSLYILKQTIPEFPSWIFIPLFLVITSLAFLVKKTVFHPT
jgi:hypothetical protein